MKKHMLSTLFTLSFLVSFSQIITYPSLRVDDSQRDSLIEIEEFWSEINEQAINDGLAEAWAVLGFVYEYWDDANGKRAIDYKKFMNLKIWMLRL